MNNNMLQLKQVAAMIDNTVLRPFITNDVWFELCNTSIEYGFKTVAINNAGIEYCVSILKESDVLVDAAVSFPLGQATMEVKFFETEDAIQKGAKEVDYVINIVELKNGNYDYIKKEMKGIVAICKKNDVVSKVIFETCYLTSSEIIKMCEIANVVKPTFIKTSTGFGEYGAKIEDVRLMRKHTDQDIKIKASGGIRTLEDFISFVEAGASRIGTSSGVKIIDEYKKKYFGN
ncbi:MAG: deoxyribose-phosphate aldolase [Spirochaetaceae bacterium]